MGRKATHPLSVGIDSEELAVAYYPFGDDPLPDRPREIVCELMHYDPTNIPPDAHIGLNLHYILPKVFVKSCRGLAEAARQMRYEWHLAEARHRKVVPEEGALLSGADLYRWGQLFRIADYTKAVNVRARAAKDAARAAAPDGHQPDGGVAQVCKVSDGKRAHSEEVKETDVEVKAEGGVQVDADVDQTRVSNAKRQRLKTEESENPNEE